MVYVQAGLLIVAGVLFLFHRSYMKEYVIQNNPGKKKYLYSFSLWIWDKFKRRSSPKVNERIKQLYLAGQEEQELEQYYIGKISFGLVLFLAVNIMSLIAASGVCSNNPIIDAYYLERNDAGEGAASYVLEYNVDEVTDGEMVIPVEERKLSVQETDALFQRVKEYLDKEVLGRNHSYNEIETDLFLPSSVPGEPVEIQWIPKDNRLLSSSGKILNESLLAEEVTGVTARIVYRESQTDYEIPLVILPRPLNEDEGIRKNLEQKIIQENKNNENNYFCLPDSLNGSTLTWNQKDRNLSERLFILGILCVVVMNVYKDRLLEDKVKKRCAQIETDYPQVVHKFVLLLSAGMTVRRVWERIVEDYEKKGICRYIYDEMALSRKEFSTGKSEIQVYESFGLRCKSQNYLKFSSLIIQYIKKGGRGMEELLLEEGRSALLIRRETAKCRGEEAGTKLLIPMMLMFIIVLVLIVLPAFLSINI